jgi:hypothetical protein
MALIPSTIGHSTNVVLRLPLFLQRDACCAMILVEECMCVVEQDRTITTGTS